MNLPNKLTVIRVIMIPVFLLFFFWNDWNNIAINNYLFAFIIFALASVTDMLDGMIARKYNLITDFGKLMDPLADKLLTISAFICLLSSLSTIGAVTLILIVSRELIITAIRLIAAQKGAVLAADKWGKLKTVSQMLWVCQELLFLSAGAALPQAVMQEWSILSVAFLAVTVLLTVGSGINYIVKNRKLFSDM